MRDVISTVYDLADLGITIVPLKSQTGPVNTAMGRLSWYAEMENEERSENVRLGQARQGPWQGNRPAAGDQRRGPCPRSETQEARTSVQDDRTVN